MGGLYACIGRKGAGTYSLDEESEEMWLDTCKPQRLVVGVEEGLLTHYSPSVMPWASRMLCPIHGWKLTGCVDRHVSHLTTGSTCVLDARRNLPAVTPPNVSHVHRREVLASGAEDLPARVGKEVNPRDGQIGIKRRLVSLTAWASLSAFYGRGHNMK